MCIAIQIPTGHRKDHQILGFYEQHSLPVLTRSQTLKWYKWGRTYGSEGSRLWPAGGWVDLDLVRSGKWWRLEPRPVLIPAIAFLVKVNDRELKHDSWFRIDGDRIIQGALATREGEQRLYIVTQPDQEHSVKLWPRLIPWVLFPMEWDN